VPQRVAAWLDVVGMFCLASLPCRVMLSPCVFLEDYMKKTIAALIVVSCATAYGAPAPKLSLCLGAGGSIIAKSKCSKGETKLSASNLGALGLQGAPGPQGPQGVPGPAGISGGFNVSACLRRRDSTTGTGLISVSEGCLQSEFAMNFGCGATSGNAILKTLKPFGYDETDSPEAATYPAGALCTYENLFSNTEVYSVQLDVTCCPR